MIVSNEMMLALRLKRGKLNITKKESARQTGVSPKTFQEILDGKKLEVQKRTFDKLNDWLLKED
ncbi:hypothetical protein QMA60_05545 [Leuconostoc suionicum]|uniref:hypothetical protein n=1 Tax=Leuconostoc suionicum TaxID=1511761 RepID=UPI0024ADF16C|nr:hypothetical protein [Leuconostoc suionicum]MDI6498161.1 hypothetical protein [Leuconostoc suionicum]MDI6500149.1 hypothetical protein [Leuconostoc suionicum]MDI6502260.1 hypothetical protein [Leuconostoc suionicum]MDI6614126.1 hypothetical protein [Leuconostoc suionicum]MDI6665080.1 hypothetical protein [Leuconostoc suionicum]